MEKINFRPLTKGLGFHPSSPATEGVSSRLPVKSFEARSTAAPSRSTFSSPRASSPIVSPPLTRKRELAQGAPSTFSPQQVQFLAAAAAAVSERSFPEKAPAALDKITEIRFGWKYLFKRAIGFGIDTVFNTMLLAVLGIIYALYEKVALDFFLNPSVLILIVCISVFFNWSFSLLQECLFKTSFGKLLIGLSLPGSRFLIFLRGIFFIPSACFLGLGILWSLIDSNRKCWHDSWSGVQPLE